MWGRRITNYSMFTVDADGSMERIDIAGSEIDDIQSSVDSAMGK